ncbi:MAG: D-alanine--D-alanine ligase [Streptococcaceae bacterium]|nr:D-alanine--D-alanine ligase [Streptococcaceae bacterium]
MKKKIVLIYGGHRCEHDVSILSAFSVLSSIYYDNYEVQTVFISPKGKWIKGPYLTNKPISPNILHLSNTSKNISPCQIKTLGAIAFPVLHGPMGEDGTIQGFLEILEMPYIGAGVLASACAMDKIISKHLLQGVGIPQVPFVPVLKKIWLENPGSILEKINNLIYPLYVKPANMGSSVGITRIEDSSGLQEALDTAFKYDFRALIEQGIKAREIEVGILGNEDIKITDAGEIIKDVAFYDYNAKYIDNKIQMKISAKIPEKIHHQACEYAKKAYEILAGSGLARCDFFLTANNELFFNELNTMPGFTQFSIFPLLWENMGLKCQDLIEELIQLAEKRFAKRQSYF